MHRKKDWWDSRFNANIYVWGGRMGKWFTFLCFSVFLKFQLQTYSILNKENNYNHSLNLIILALDKRSPRATLVHSGSQWTSWLGRGHLGRLMEALRVPQPKQQRTSFLVTLRAESVHGRTAEKCHVLLAPWGRHPVIPNSETKKQRGVSEVRKIRILHLEFIMSFSLPSTFLAFGEGKRRLNNPLEGQGEIKASDLPVLSLYLD